MSEKQNSEQTGKQSNPQAARKTNKQRLKEITDSIETGIRELFESEKYRKYLSVMSRFHKYSLNNTLLIYMQRPNATHVAGFTRWRDQFGRNVKKGEKGIKIIAPTPFKKKIEEQKLDPDTRLPMLDKDGKAIMEEKEIKIPMYKPVTVFDVSQTEGKPLPQLAGDLTGNVQNYDVFMEALRRSSPVPIAFEAMSEDMDGYFNSKEQKIALRSGMSEVQTVSAAVHEMAHARLHNRKEAGKKYECVELFGNPALFSNGRLNQDMLPEGLYCYDLRGSDDDPGLPVALEDHVGVNHAGSVITAKPIKLPETGFIKLGESLNFSGKEQCVREFFNAAYPEKAKISRNTKEVQAESISYAVCQYYGIETGENSFGYIATWSKDKDLKELKASLETINKTSSVLITDIDRNYAQVMKEREAEVSKEQEEETKAPQKTEALYLADDKTYIHVRKSDEGWNYCLYDRASQKLTDEGVIEGADTIGEARKRIFALRGMAPQKLILADMAVLPELKYAQAEKSGVERAIEPPLEEAPPLTAPDNGCVPDPAVSVESMNAYGYTDADMLPLTKKRALELMERDVTVYLLYENNTEAMAFDTKDVVGFDGLFGITRKDWEAVKEEYAPAAKEKNERIDVEKTFLESPKDSYAIYQLAGGPKTDRLRYMNTEYLRDKGLTVSRENYTAAYTGELPRYGDTEESLNELYKTFNINRPKDFTGHSLSVSDIIALKRNGEVSCHYVDSSGFKKLTGFIQPENYLKNAEISKEDDYGMIDGIINNGTKEPTAAELERRAKSGQPISIMQYVEALHRESGKNAPERDLSEPAKKPSVLAKLKNPVRPVKPEKTAPKRSAEREL